MQERNLRPGWDGRLRRCERCGRDSSRRKSEWVEDDVYQIKKPQKKEKKERGIQTCVRSRWTSGRARRDGAPPPEILPPFGGPLLPGGPSPISRGRGIGSLAWDGNVSCERSSTTQDNLGFSPFFVFKFFFARSKNASQEESRQPAGVLNIY